MHSGYRRVSGRATLLWLWIIGAAAMRCMHSKTPVAT
jgi:hypothetical protein